MRNKYLTKILLCLLFIVAFAFSYAQDGPGDPGGDPSNGGGDPLGGNAAISGGMILLVSLSAVYGGMKVYYLIKKAPQIKN